MSVVLSFWKKLLVACICLVAIFILQTGGSARAQDDIVVYLPMLSTPNTGIHLGVFFDPQVDMKGALQSFETLTGKHHSIYHYYTYWGFGDFNNHRFLVDQIVEYGAIPMLSFMSIPGPGNPGCSSNEWNLDSINRGDHDTYLRTFASQIAQYPSQFLFRWGHEMNLNEYSWSGFCNGGNIEATQKFVTAFQRIVTLFREEGATNVKWIWSPSYTHWPAEAWNETANYYPGNGYVDWIGVVGYNFGASSIYSGNRWTTFTDLFHAFLTDAATRYPRKPVMLADYASTEDDGGDKAVWISDAFNQMKQYPNLHAIVYFNITPPEYSPPMYFKIDSSPDSLNAYQSSIQDPYFRTDLPR